MTNCDVYWGSHGCHLDRGHSDPHFCCCDCTEGKHPWDDEPGVVCVGRFPYYGSLTRFYGDDAQAAQEWFDGLPAEDKARPPEPSVTIR